jgi:hypothetical protein
MKHPQASPTRRLLNIGVERSTSAAGDSGHSNTAGPATEGSCP